MSLSCRMRVWSWAKSSGQPTADPPGDGRASRRGHHIKQNDAVPGESARRPAATPGRRPAERQKNASKFRRFGRPPRRGRRARPRRGARPASGPARPRGPAPWCPVVV